MNDERIRKIVCDYLAAQPGASKERIHEAVVRNLHGEACVNIDDFEVILRAVAEESQQPVRQNLFEFQEPELFGSHVRSSWHLRVPAQCDDDAHETDAAQLEAIISEYLKKHPEDAGTIRKARRFANALIAGKPIRDENRPRSIRELLQWLTTCRRSGLFEHGKAIYEKGGLNSANLTDEQQVQAEDDYRICVRRGGNDKANPGQQRRKKWDADE